MYLQTRILLMAVCARWKRQPAGYVHRSLIAFGPAMLLLFGGMLVGATAGAQGLPAVLPVTQNGQAAKLEVDNLNFIPRAPVDSDAISTDGSSSAREVSSAGSSSAAEANPSESSSFNDALPEAPSAMLQDLALRASTPEATRIAVSGKVRVAPLYRKHIPDGWEAQPLTARDKMVLGARNLYSPFALLGYVVTAGYEQAENGQPNYGTNRGAFVQRLGAISLRDTTEDAFTDMVFAPLLHQDPRYYVEGPQHGFLHRVVYAVTRPIITRTDSGRETANGSELLGYASASALSYTYYPKINQNFHDTAATFGGSLLGSALGNLVSEFSGQMLEAIHLKKPQ